MLNLTHMFRSETAVLAHSMQRALASEAAIRREAALVAAAKKSASANDSGEGKTAARNRKRDEDMAKVLAYLLKYGPERNINLKKECGFDTSRMNSIRDSLKLRAYIQPFDGDEVGSGLQPRWTITPAGKRWLAAFQPQEQA